MTTAHALVITHHDFETYPSWVSSLTYFHFLETEFRYSCIFNVPASIASSGLLVNSKCCLLETLQVRSTETNEGVETHCNSTASGSSRHSRDLASLKPMLRLHNNVPIRSWKISAITTQPRTRIFVSNFNISFFQSLWCSQRDLISIIRKCQLCTHLLGIQHLDVPHLSIRLPPKRNPIPLPWYIFQSRGR